MFFDDYCIYSVWLRCVEKTLSTSGNIDVAINNSIADSNFFCSYYPKYLIFVCLKICYA